MKIQIRQGVFETNSSSTHVLSLFNKDIWKKFTDNDKLFMDWWDTRELFSIDDLRKKYEEERKESKELSDKDFQEWLEEKLDDREFYSYEEFCGEYEILTEEVPDSPYIAISIYGYE